MLFSQQAQKSRTKESDQKGKIPSCKNLQVSVAHDDLQVLGSKVCGKNLGQGYHLHPGKNQIQKHVKNLQAPTMKSIGSHQCNVGCLNQEHHF